LFWRALDTPPDGEADRFPTVDRTRARTNIRAGMLVGGLALFLFGFAFYVTILYLA
jgi:hypothetical protein